MAMRFYFFWRAATATGPAGVTVSKRPELPAGDFMITSYVWNRGVLTLWFIDDDKFTKRERQAAMKSYGASAQS